MAARHESSRPAFASAAIVVAMCLAAGLFAARLNARYYDRNAPFYDSMSYHAQTHRVMTRARSEGVLPALGIACRSSTVCLPLAMAAVVGPLVEPSRLFGVGIQSLELVAFAATLAFYLRRIRGLDAATATLAVVPFLAWRCLYEPNGGLSDLRMDLSLAILYSTTVLWYLIAIQTNRIGHYLLLGVAAAAACLFRATAPVYLVIGLSLPAIADLVPRATRRERLRGLAVAAATAAAGCGWFFLLNYPKLHYYYVVWNTDANAKLPFSEAIRHAEFAARHVGLPAALLAAAFPIAWLVDGWLARRPPFAHRPFSFDWRIAWIGIAPIVLLVSRGAGLNPFVSMPAAFGLTMLLMLPASGAVAGRLSRPAFVGLVIVAVCCMAAAASRGWRMHFGGVVDSMAAHRKTIRDIVVDAGARGRSDVRYATTHCFCLNQDSLENVALFDMPLAALDGRSPRIDGVTIRQNPAFAIAAEADWAAVPGDTTAAKLDHILAVADREIDYLVIPDETTTRFVQERISHNVINRHAVAIRERILGSGRWEPVGVDIRNGEDEVVRIYRNTAL